MSLSDTLLPAGLVDTLPPDAAHEADIIERLMARFTAHGYERIKPPLIEFETSLLAGPSAAMASQTFRVMDPVSQRMMGIRADMTPQIARIATTRLGNAPRPLRLSYAGDVLRVKGSQLRPERQFGQVGCELIGSLHPMADAEIALLAITALQAVGIEHLSLDLNVPTLVPTLYAALGVPAETMPALREALDRKDEEAVTKHGGPATQVLHGLLKASGSVQEALTALSKLNLPAEVEADCKRLNEVVRLISAAMPDLPMTVDLVERRGFEYQTGVSFTLFARDARGELGRGGRYRAGLGDNSKGEPATGFTLYMDTVLRAVPSPQPAPKVLVPFGTPLEEISKLQTEGYVAVASLETEAVSSDQAKRTGCSHVFVENRLSAVK